MAYYSSKSPLNSVDWAVSDASTVEVACNQFNKSRALVIRGLKQDLNAFEQFSKAICQSFHRNAIRSSLADHSGDGYSTEVFKENFILLGHSESTYKPFPAPPQVCIFKCTVAPIERGGETTCIDGRAMLGAMDRGLANRLEQQGVVYEVLWEPTRWRCEFGVETVPDLCKVLNASGQVKYTVSSEGALHAFFKTPAIRQFKDGSRAFSNGILAHLDRMPHPRYANLPVYTNSSNRMYFGDETPFSDEDIINMIDAHDEVAMRHRWCADDILILDNQRYMHGREMTVAPCRRELLSRFGMLRPELLSS